MADTRREPAASRQIWIVAGLIAGLAVIGAIVLLITSEGSDTMREISPVTTTTVAIPPIDLVQPGETETATFGLG